ncbi:LuxR family transcriptional regulator [Saccharothrix yanglingensis]|uniref:Helix-turn-helix transcriptional regulator n=1 Tax=Saccharothrix yanglingensis TaxID=659496 RepID=A0ABU0WVY7_9PSEU|nr:LuxR family transcriptional regulator [Saccharothrix yanglingensis]MDQ2583547.1 helix-turn-helix transcriptional regulator [Saccharothrix yanglingensis]
MGVNWGQQNHRIDPREASDFLRGLLIGCEGGTGETVLVDGAPASGKTRLQDQVVARAGELGILTLTASGAADEQDVDGGVIDQLLACPGVPRALAEQFGDWDDERIAGVCGALHRLARERPVLVAVDDLQHVDGTSVRLLLRLQRRTRSAAVLLVLSGSGSGGGLPFAAQPHRHVQLTPLSERAIAELVGEGPDWLPGQVHELSAGNPLLADALVDAHRAGADADAAYAEAVRQLLHRCGSPLREVATAIAVLDTDMGLDALAVVAGVDPGDAEASACRLADSGLVEGVRFRQPAAAAAIIGGLRGPARARLHSRAADVKHSLGLASPDIARHLVAAGEADVDWAPRTLLEAAEQVMLDDDVEFATRCLELAASAPATGWVRQRISQLLAKITWRVNPTAAAPHLRTRWAAGDSLDRSDRVALARQALWFGDRDTFERAFAALVDDEPLDPRTVAELSLAGHWHYGASVTLPDSDDPWLHTVKALSAVWRAEGTERASAGAERILHSCRLSDTSLEALCTAILALAHDDKADRAEGWCASLSEEAEHRGAVTWKAMLDAIAASLVLRRGDVAGAAERADRALALLDGPNWGVAISHPLATLLSAHTEAGAFKAAAAVLRRPLPDAALTTLGGVRYLRARGRFHLATNRGLAAVSDFQQCQRTLRGWDLEVPVLVPWRTDLAEANLRLGNPTLAVELANQQLAYAAPSDHGSRGAALRVLAQAGDAAERQGMLNRAAEEFRASGDRLELARTTRMLNRLGQDAQRARGPVAPVRVRRQLARVAVSRSVGPRPERAGSRATAGVPAPVTVPVAVGAPATTPAVLSEAELRVAELAAAGRTNRQISETLYITVSTVEQHLTRVYRKLGVPGRSALAGEFTAAEGGR